MNASELRNNLWFKKNPLIAILRGVETSEVLDVAKVLIKHDFRFIEIPLNSPNAIESIKLLVSTYGDKAIIGAGTVTTEDKLDSVLEVGAKLIVTPNMNPGVIKKAIANDCLICCGVYTPTEAFNAIHYGASILKLFPSDTIKASGIKAVKSVLPADVMCVPVGGVNAEVNQMIKFVQSGAEGFGLGSNLYKRGMSLEQLEANVIEYRKAWSQVSNNK